MSPVVAYKSVLARPEHSFNTQQTALGEADPLTISQLLIKKDGPYVTLTITKAYTTYATTILLGNTFPTSPETSNPTSQSSTTSQSQPASPGIPTSSITGIVVGCIAGLLLLIGVFYIYEIRASKLRAARKKRGSRGSSRSNRGRGKMFLVLLSIFQCRTK